MSGALLVLSICGCAARLASTHSFADPPGQPAQLVSQLRHDAQLADPFFGSGEWSHPWHYVPLGDGRYENALGGEVLLESELPRQQHTARCSTEHQGAHPISFCDLSLGRGGRLEIHLHDESASTADHLGIVVQSGRFASQYWTFYPLQQPGERLTWTTTRQELVLSADRFARGEALRGRIDFECVQQSNLAGREPVTIAVQGVFEAYVR